MTREDDVRAPEEVVDAAIHAYVNWRDACFDAREAYRGWSEANKADRVLAFYAYSAALDREERAANVYATAVRRLTDECGHGLFAEPPRTTQGSPSGKHREEGGDRALR